MKLQSLHIGRFGLREELCLDDFSDELTVILGSSDSDKTTTIQFLRWLLFGKNDAAVATQLGYPSSAAEGTLTVVSGQQTHVVRRRDDGTQQGQLSVDPSDSAGPESARLNQLLGGLSPIDFDLHFLVSFDHPSHPDRLARSAVQRRFDMFGAANTTSRVGQIQRELTELRTNLSQLPATTLTKQSMVDRRNRLQTQWDSLSHLEHDDWGTAERDYESISTQIAEIEAELYRKGCKLHGKESTIAARRQQLEEIQRRNEASKQAALEEFRFRLKDRETHLETWRNVLEDLRDRRRQIDVQVRSQQEIPPFENLRQTDAFRALNDELCELRHCEEAMTRLVHCLATPRQRTIDGTLEPELDNWLDDLTRRRDTLVRDLEALEDRHRELTERRERMETRRRRVPDPLEADSIQREIASVTAQLNAWQQRNTWQQQIDRLEDELARLSQQPPANDVEQEASRWLRAMTGGKFPRLGFSQDRLWVEDSVGQTIQDSKLDYGTRDQLHLAFAMALAADFARKGISLPLILHDAFVNIESRDHDLLAETIRTFSRQGHQVILITRQRQVLEAFQRWDIRQMELSGELPRKDESPVTPQDVDRLTIHPEVDHIRVPRNAEHSESPLQPATPDRTPVASMSSTRMSTATVSELSQLDSLQWLTDEVLERLDAMEIHTAGALLELAPTVAQRELNPLGISEAVIRNWQQTLDLACHVDGILLRDAGVLVASGITDVRRLSDFDGQALEEHLGRYLQSVEGRSDFPNRSNDYHRQRLTQWVHSARRAKRTRIDVRHSAFPDRGTMEIPSESIASSERRTRRSARFAQVRSPRRAHATRLPSVARVGRRRRGSIHDKASPQNESDAPQFYLSLNAPLIDAPSIGAKTAAYFEAVGISSVAQFLDAKAEATASHLGRPRIKADTIRQWQAQARLVCSVSQLQGHDAQLLVRCGVADAKQLASMEPAILWDTIQPYLETKEAQRLFRKGKAPDLAEITRWIRAAQDARSLKAA